MATEAEEINDVLFVTGQFVRSLVCDGMTIDRMREASRSAKVRRAIIEAIDEIVRQEAGANAATMDGYRRDSVVRFMAYLLEYITGSPDPRMAAELVDAVASDADALNALLRETVTSSLMLQAVVWYFGFKDGVIGRTHKEVGEIMGFEGSRSSSLVTGAAKLLWQVITPEYRRLTEKHGWPIRQPLPR